MKYALPFLIVLSAAGQEVVWEARPGFRDFGRMAASGGVVLSGNVNGGGGTFAFDAATGKVLWRAPGHLIAGPVIDGKLGFTVNQGTGLSAFDLRTGKVVWRAQDVESSRATDLLASGGRVFAVGEYGKLRVFEAASGRPAWEHLYLHGGTLGSCPTTPVISDGVLYYSGGENARPGQGVFLWALEVASGKEIWRFAAKTTPRERYGECVTAPAVGDGMVIVSSDNVVFGVDAQTGKERWRREIYRKVDGTEYRRQPSAAAIISGRAYAIIEEALLGWDVRDGRQVFEYKGNFPSSSRNPTLVGNGGLLYFTATLTETRQKDNPQGFLYAFDPAASQIKWSHKVNRDLRYETNWPTRFFLITGPDVYYENHSILVKLRP